MAKAHCKKHKRYVPSCVECQSAALRETVGFPATNREEPPEEGTPVDIPPPNAEENNDEEPSDIAEWEPEVVEEEEAADEPSGLPSYTPSRENACNFHPEGCPEGSHRPETDPLADGDYGDAPVVPEAEATISAEELEAGSTMTPLERAMQSFPQRLIPEGSTEVCDEERPGEPYMASYRELIQRAVASYLEVGLEPEDAAIVVAAEAIYAEKLTDIDTGFGDGTADEENAAFEAGLEAAPEMTGCIDDYNQGFNDGLKALHRLMIGYYAGDEDSVAYAFMRWVERQMMTMEKK